MTSLLHEVPALINSGRGILEKNRGCEIIIALLTHSPKSKKPNLQHLVINRYFDDNEHSEALIDNFIAKLVSMGETEVAFLICYIAPHVSINGRASIELPPFYIRKRLVEINRGNLNTLIVLRGAGAEAYVLKSLNEFQPS